jgi:hypothetical protein
MGFLFTSILLSVGLTVLLNLVLRRSLRRARDRQPSANAMSDGVPFGGVFDALFSQGHSATYSFDETTGRWTKVTQVGSDIDVPERPDIPK